MIFDVLLIILFAALIFFSVRRGAVRTLSGFIVSAVSYFAATVFGQMLANYAYQIFVKPAIDSAVTKAMENVTSDAADSVVAALPAWLTSLLGMSDESLLDLFSGPLDSANDAVLEAVNKVVYPLVMAIIVFFVTIILFFAFYLICRRFLIGPLTKLFRFPLLNTADRILGGVIGLIHAILLTCMIAYLIRLILINVGSSSSWLNEATINKSFIFRWFYRGNIFSWIGSLIAI